MTAELIERVGALLSPTEASRELGLSSQMIRWLWKRGQLDGAETALGLLVTPESVEREKARRAQVQAGRRRRG